MMGNAYYAQSDNPGSTMRVRDLIEALKQFDPDETVVFQTPLYGVFGSNTAYAIEAVALIEMAERRLMSYRTALPHVS